MRISDGVQTCALPIYTAPKSIRLPKNTLRAVTLSMTSLLSRAIAPPANGHGRRNFPCLHKDERRLRPKLGQGATKLREDGRIERMTRVDRYIAGLIAVPLLSTLVIAAMLLLLDKMLRLFDFVMSEGGPVSVVWRMLANMLPEYMSLGIPIGQMLGILLAFRKLALSSDIDALRSVGFSYWRLLRVPYIYACALALLKIGRAHV